MTGPMMAPSSVAEIAERAYVDEGDAREMLVWLVGDGAELDPDAIPHDYADAITAFMEADVRALAYPPSSLVGDLAQAYRDTGDDDLLDELRERGYPAIVEQLRFERPQPDDLPSVLRTRAETSKAVDLWIAAMPPERKKRVGRVLHQLGSPTDR